MGSLETLDLRVIGHRGIPVLGNKGWLEKRLQNHFQTTAFPAIPCVLFGIANFDYWGMLVLPH